MNRFVKCFWENPWFSIPVLLFLNAGLVLAYYVPYGTEVLYFNPLREEPFNSIFRFCTLLGEPFAYIVAGIAMLFWRYRFALLILVAGLLTLASSYYLKDHIGTPRPLTWFNQGGIRDLLIVVPDVELASGNTSFPSGHTMAAFTLYSLLAGIVMEKQPRLGLLFAVLALLVGISRIFLAQHFLADVLGGATVGLLLGWIALQFNRLSFMQKSLTLDRGLLG